MHDRFIQAGASSLGAKKQKNATGHSACECETCGVQSRYSTACTMKQKHRPACTHAWHWHSVTMPFGQKKAAVDTPTQAFSWEGFGGLQLGKEPEVPETPQWSAEKLHSEVEAMGFESIESAFLVFLNGPAGSAWQALVAAKLQDLQRGGSLPEEPVSGPVQLCLGGKKSVPGWTIVNALELPGVDVVADIRNLKQWRDCSVDVVYMSHTLEHINYKSELQPCLRQIARILKPGGIFKCSVPDLAILCKMYLAELEREDEFETKALAHYRKFPATFPATLPASMSPAWTPEGAKVPIMTVTIGEAILIVH